MSVIGLDIGNENCVIAAAKRGGIDVLLNDEAKRESPGVVSFGDKQRFLGSTGAAFATANPKSTISQIKRLIGRQYKEQSVQEELKLLPFATCEGPRGGILIELVYMKEKMMFMPLEILGMLFKHMKQIAEKNLESAVVDCVIGIPSYFTDLQRREYLDAATIAGLKPLMLMHDGTATALGYGMYKTDLSDKGPTVVVFVDIGHCDTQVTLAAFVKGKMRILSHTFDQNLGGRDFDELLFEHFAAQFKEQYKIDVHSNARASIRLRASCEKLKKVLSANTEAPLSIECLIDDTDVRGIITREQFENLSRELLERVTVPCIKAVNESGIRLDEIYTVELVGSGSRIPAIVKKLTSLFKKEPTRTLNASECVARGCALRCAMLSPTLQVQAYKVRDFFPYSIGLPIDEGQNKANHEITLFSKGSSFPAITNGIIYRGSTPLHVQVFYTNKNDFPASKSLKVGHFMIGPRESSGEEKVRTEFNVLLNKHGIVVIESAVILDDKNVYSYLQKMMGNNHTSNLPFSENLVIATTEDELRHAQEREEILAEQDKKVEQTKDQRNTLESFVYDTRSKLSSAYRSFATDTEKDGIIKSLQETEDWLYEDSDDDESVEPDYTVKLEDLRKLLDPIEKRYKDEIARTKVTKAMRTFIEERRSATELMSLRHKDEVNDVCLRAEQWLNHYQQQEGFTNIDPIRWASVAQEAMGNLEWNLRVIMTSKPLFPEHEPVDTDQRDQCVDQCDHPVDSTHMSSNQRNQTQREEPVCSNLSHKLMDRNQMNQPMSSNQREKTMGSNQRERTMGSNQRDRTMGSNQRNQTVGSNQTDQAVGMNQRVGTTGLNQKNQTVGSNQRDQAVGMNQRDQAVGSNQRDQAVGKNQRDRTLPSNQREKIMGSNQREKTVSSNQRKKTVGSNQKEQTVGSNQRGKIMGSNQGGQVVSLNQGQGGQIIGLNQKDQTIGSDQRFPTSDSHQRDQIIDSNQRHRTFGSYLTEDPLNLDKKELPVKLDARDQPVNSDIKDHHVTLDKRDQPQDSDQRDQPVNSDVKDQPVNSDIKDQHVSLEKMDQPQDSDQKDQQDYMEE